MTTKEYRYPEKRIYSLGIWGFTLGYFIFYIPYSGLTKALSKGLLPGMEGSIAGFELLPATIIGTVLTMPLITTMLGWWKYATYRAFLGMNILFPSRWTLLSGISFAVIVATTTLAYTFNGVSIVFALLLMRGGVLVLAPIMDITFSRQVRWFSWMALVLSFVALGVAFVHVRIYTLSLIVVLNLAAYLAGYIFRLRFMTGLAKTHDHVINKRFFVEEQMVAMIVLVLIPGLVALTGVGEIGMDLRRGFTTFLVGDLVAPALLIGVLYGCLGIFGTLIYLDRRENTFCIPLNRCSSLLSGMTASYLIAILFDQRPASSFELAAASLIILSILFLSPLHHFRLHLSDLDENLSARARG